MSDQPDPRPPVHQPDEWTGHRRDLYLETLTDFTDWVEQVKIPHNPAMPGKRL